MPNFMFTAQTFPAKGIGPREGLSLNLERSDAKPGEPKSALLFAKADVVDPKTQRRVDDSGSLILWDSNAAQIGGPITVSVSWAKDTQHFYDDPFAVGAGGVQVAQASAG